jgi:hypothetical protein
VGAGPLAGFAVTGGRGVEFGALFGVGVGGAVGIFGRRCTGEAGWFAADTGRLGFWPIVWRKGAAEGRGRGRDEATGLAGEA